MFPAKEPQTAPWQVWEALFVVAGPTHNPRLSLCSLCGPPSSPDSKDGLRSELQSLKGNLLGDEDDHALSQGTRVGPNRQACVILLRVQSGLVVYLSQEFLGGVIYCWDLTCQREQLKN